MVRHASSSSKHSRYAEDRRVRVALDSPTPSQHGDLSEDETDGDGMEEDDIDFKDLMKR